MEIENISEKVLTKGRKGDRIAGLSGGGPHGAVTAGRAPGKTLGLREKKKRKSFENLLTRGRRCGRINKLSPEGGSGGSLKIEQQRSTKDSENSFEFKDALSN